MKKVILTLLTTIGFCSVTNAEIVVLVSNNIESSTLTKLYEGPSIEQCNKYKIAFEQAFPDKNKFDFKCVVIK